MKPPSGRSWTARSSSWPEGYCSSPAAAGWTLNTGTPVVLQTEPVDPRSLFMGDYARLAYPISRLRLDGETGLGGDTDFKRHDTVWVALKPDADGAKAVSVHRERSAIAPGLLALKGEVQNLGDYGWDRATSRPVKQRTLQVRYGIEQYYVQEPTGGQVERPRGGEKVAILAAIDARGKAGIREIQEIRILGDWAFMWAKLTVVVTPPGEAQTMTRAGHTLSILKKQSGKWVLARDANMLAPVPNSSRW